MDFTLCAVLVHKAFKKNGKKAISRDWFSDQRGKFLFKICWAEPCWRDCSCKLGRLAHVLWAVPCSVLVRWGQSWKAWRSELQDELISIELGVVKASSREVTEEMTFPYRFGLWGSSCARKTSVVLTDRGSLNRRFGWSQSTNGQCKTPNFQIFVFGPVSDASEIRRVKVKAQKWVVPKCQTLEDLFTFFDTPKYFEFWSTSSALAGASFGLWHCVFMAKSLGFAPRQIRLQQTGDRVWFAFVTLFSANF